MYTWIRLSTFQLELPCLRICIEEHVTPLKLRGIFILIPALCMVVFNKQGHMIQQYRGFKSAADAVINYPLVINLFYCWWIMDQAKSACMAKSKENAHSNTTYSAGKLTDNIHCK